MNIKRAGWMIVAIIVLHCATVYAVNFGTAMQEKMISYEVNADNRLAAKMKVKIRNRRAKKTTIRMEPGRIFYPSVVNVQPFVVAREALIALDPDEEKDVWVFARCGNSRAKAPTDSLPFLQTAMGNREMVDALEMMNAMQIESMQFYQNVIWFFTNKLDIAAVHAVDMAEAEQMQVVRELCRKNQLDLPKYKKKYKTAESGNDMEFSGIPEKLEANVELVLLKASDLQIKLVDEQGNTVRLLGVRNLLPAGVHTIPVDIDLLTLQAARYTLRITDANGIVVHSMLVEV